MKAKHLARLVGVSESTIKAWRAGRRQPCHAAKRLLDVLELVRTLSPVLYASLVAEVVPRPTIHALIADALKPDRKAYKADLAARKASGEYADKRRTVRKEYDLDYLRAEYAAPYSPLFDDPNLSEAEYNRLKRLIGK